MQQLQRNTAIPPAQVSIEELKATNPSDAQQTLLPNEREGIPAKEVEQRIECVPLERIVTEQYQRILNMKNVAGIVKNFDPAKLGVLVVSHRTDGTYAVLDGQHRLTALRRLGTLCTALALGLTGALAHFICGGWDMTRRTASCWKA